jgi:hypothetical protein
MHTVTYSIDGVYDIYMLYITHYIIGDTGECTRQNHSLFFLNYLPIFSVLYFCLQLTVRTYISINFILECHRSPTVTFLYSRDSMASLCSSSIDSSMTDNSENSPSSTEINGETYKYRIIPQNSCEIPNEILEIQQIEYEQRLIVDQINRIDEEKQRLQDLLNLLQSTKSNNRKKNTTQHYRKSQRIDEIYEYE